jgi:hypothetical protein
MCLVHALQNSGLQHSSAASASVSLASSSTYDQLPIKRCTAAIQGLVPQLLAWIAHLLPGWQPVELWRFLAGQHCRDAAVHREAAAPADNLLTLHLLYLVLLAAAHNNIIILINFIINSSAAATREKLCYKLLTALAPHAAATVEVEKEHTHDAFVCCKVEASVSIQLR